jgi:hypothetical protein
MTPRCHHCGGEVFAHDGEAVCLDCTSFRPTEAGPDLPRCGPLHTWGLTPPCDTDPVRLVDADPDT